jgi:hypothetical protein
MRQYVESFDAKGNGWIGWHGNGFGARALEITHGYAISRSPWWVDYNHAPPGAGYLHLHYVLHTTVNQNTHRFEQISGLNRFIEGGFPLDFRGARVSVRLRGQMKEHGAQLMFLAQADVGTSRVNHVLHAQPIQITSDWSTQTITLEPDDAQWTCLGSRQDRTATYSQSPIEPVLADLNVDIILVHFPLDIRPTGPMEGDPHVLRAGEDYPVDESRLPSGEIHLDEIQIAFR